LPSNATLRRLWKLFEYPETSRAGFVVALLSVTITLVSIVLFCIETLPTFSTSHCVKDEAPNFLDPFFIIETICTASQSQLSLTVAACFGTTSQSVSVQHMRNFQLFA